MELISMAGWVHHGTILDVTETDWRKSFLINLDSMYFVIKAAIPGLQRNGGGSIVNMASLASSVQGFPFELPTALLRLLLLAYKISCCGFHG